MPGVHVVSALVEKRARIAGEIENLQKLLREAVIQLDHVEATLRIFDPAIDINQIGPRRVIQVHHAHHGDITRIVLDALRTAMRPIATSNITELVMKERGVDTNDKALCNVMGKRVGACLRHMARKRGTIRSLPGPGQQNMWELNR